MNFTSIKSIITNVQDRDKVKMLHIDNNMKKMMGEEVIYESTYWIGELREIKRRMRKIIVTGGENERIEGENRIPDDVRNIRLGFRSKDRKHFRVSLENGKFYKVNVASKARFR